MKLFFVGVLSIALAPHLMATVTPTVPEVDASSAVGAITLLSGMVLVLKARKK